ncbi:hypothetical protein M409DRAFT_70272 [Zasmidium cellare ATCC 36951]|uniref:F-box domain-containing protein n=1 Tax=Zasmidium cellare ATCC 36951 TaxID=1080233 RepID=A0A6A6C1K4_ZASCE|nr:uncharacterized protein M409DRAFT_70272 [Zasmidium cellare ATCC 36951]KAF2160743.1 hypothetical protein M409DRAFT_70272 [Zasmidium cellare ATCC 36951]
MALIDLPAELISHIFTYLRDEDVFSARLSSRTLDKASFDYFGRHFFRKKGFMITTPSLTVLEEIANHKELSKFVQHVWINPDCFTLTDFRYEWSEDGGRSQNDGGDDPEDADSFTDAQTAAAVNRELPQKTNEQIEAYLECTADYMEVLNDNYDGRPTPLEARLTTAFAKLPNLTTIGMRRSENHSPYGWSALQKSVGSDPRQLGPLLPVPSPNLSPSSTLFIALLSAVAQTGVQIRRLYTDVIELDNMNSGQFPRSKLKAACSSMLYLELNIIRGLLEPTLKPTNLTPRLLDDPSNSEFGENLVTLLKSMPNLKEIGLQTLRARSLGHSSIDAINPEKSYPYIAFNRLATEAPLPHLTRIKLEKITTTSFTLQTFLQPCAQRLTSLKLRDISLQSTPSSPGPWRELFDFLLAHCPRLEYILFYHLMHDAGGVSFVEAEPEARNGETADEGEEYVVGQAVFEKYSHITLEVKGREAVREKLEEVRERHWYHRPLFSYAMDEELWHTDTSDEEW